MRRKRQRRDGSVIRTEPDRRRATGGAEDDEFTIPDEKSDVPRRQWITSSDTVYQRASARKLIASKPRVTFPFLSLPVEVRIMVYKHLLVSSTLDSPILLAGDKLFRRGGIEIAIILTSRLIRDEAIEVLYNEIKCSATFSIYERGAWLREDEPKTLSMTSRRLRSGRAVDMTKHRGLIYEHKVAALRHMQFDVYVYDPTRSLPWACAEARRAVLQLGAIYRLVFSRLFCNSKEVVHGIDWVVKIRFPGGDMPLSALRIMLLPLLAREVALAVGDGRLRIVLSGKVQKKWRTIFWRFHDGPGFITNNVEEMDEKPRNVNISSLYKALAGFMDAWEDDLVDDSGDEIW